MKKVLSHSFVLLFLLFFAGIVFLSCKITDNQQKNLRPFLKKIIWLYKKTNVNIDGDSIPIAVMFTDSNYLPIENVRCSLIVDDTKREYLSDELGYILFRIPKENKKVSCMCPSKLTANLVLSGEFFSYDKIVNIETGEGMKKITSSGIRILYPSGEDDIAKKIMETMKKEKEFIKNTLGIEPVTWIVILTYKSEPIFYLSSYGISLGVDSIDFRMDYIRRNYISVLVHEWVENTLLHKIGIYDSKTSNRWIGDGLAQYVEFEWLKEEWPEYFSHSYITLFSSLLHDDGKVYNLLEWKRSTPSLISLILKKQTEEMWIEEDRKYWFTPYFWAKIVDKSKKENVIQEFLKGFRNLENKNSKNIIQLLSRLTDLDIKTELVISVKEVRDNITKYWPIPIPPEDMAMIKGGKFIMGDNKNQSTTPAHEVKLNPFLIDKFEVSNKKFCEFLNEKGNQIEGEAYWFNEHRSEQIEKVKDKYYPKKGFEKNPIMYISWFGAQAYCKWAGKRLPTEAEWEYAASNAGKTKYPWGSKWCETCCNWKENGKLDGYIMTCPVDGFINGKNRYDCYNMVGNVFEWVSDWYGTYKAISEKNPKGPDKGSLKVHRGGCYKYEIKWQNSTARIGGEPQAKFPCVGFRCAKNAYPIETDK